jgi:hypothetical protein
MRAVAAARATAWTELYLRVGPLLTSTRRGQLDRLLATDPDLRVAPLVWLNTGATQASPETIKTEVDKLGYLRGIDADRLDLSMVPPERVRELAGWARRSTPRALRRLDSDRRYPVLLAAAATTCTEIVDEVVRLFDQALAATDGRARRQVAEQRAALVKGDYERLRLLDEILDIVLDDGLDDAAVGANLRHLGRDRLAGAARPPDERPPADGGPPRPTRSPPQLPPPVRATRARRHRVLGQRRTQRGPQRGHPAAPPQRRGPPHRPRRRPHRVRPGPLAALPGRRPCGRQDRRVPALLGTGRPVRPARRPALRRDLGGRVPPVRQPGLLPDPTRAVAGHPRGHPGAHPDPDPLRRPPRRSGGGAGRPPRRAGNPARRARRGHPARRRQRAAPEPAGGRGRRPAAAGRARPGC